MRRPVAVVLALSLWLVPVVVLAQEATPGPGPSAEETATPTPPPAPVIEVDVPSADEIGAAASEHLLAGLGQTFLDSMRDGFPQVFGGWLGESLEHILRALWDAAAFFLGSVNIFTQLPPFWTVDLPAVALARDRLLPLGASVVTLATVLTVALAALGTLIGRPFGWLFERLPVLLLTAGGMVAAPALMAWWITFVNALSGTLLDPLTGLPGLSEMTAVGQVLTLGWVALLYVVFALWFLFQRLRLLVYAALCLAVAPLALAALALPLGMARRFFDWWLSTFVGVTVTQVLQALCLGIGANVIIVGGSSGSGPAEGAQEAMAGLVGAGSILAAGTVPGLLLKHLLPAAGAGGLTLALRLATTMAGLALGGAAAGAGSAWVRLVVPALGAGGPTPGAAPARVTEMGSSGHVVRSLLAERPLALPPPQDEAN